MINHSFAEDVGAVVALTLFLATIAVWAIILGG